MADDEIILSELSDDELVLQMHDDLYDGLKEEIEEASTSCSSAAGRPMTC
jgi:methanogenic corrinoid protein MtbC1